jgi:AcrR family transcriptional regulator
VAAAIEVIAEIGWAQTSIRKIADRVGVAMSAVLYHFGTKDNLVDAIIEEMYRTALANVVPAVTRRPRRPRRSPRISEPTWPISIRTDHIWRH